MRAYVFECNGDYYDYVQDGFGALNNATLYSEEKEDAKIFEHDPSIKLIPVEVTLLENENVS